MVMIEAISETDILEKLNASPNVRGFFIAAVEVFEVAVDALIQRVFRKDDFAVQSVVGPLLHDSGPLGDLSVRLKLLFGLGVLPDELYHDIEEVIRIRNTLNHDANEYEFTDPAVLIPLKELSSAMKMGIVQLEVLEPDEDLDQQLYQLQLQRQRQIVKSGLSLAIVDICTQLNKDSPF